MEAFETEIVHLDSLQVQCRASFDSLTVLIHENIDQKHVDCLFVSTAKLFRIICLQCKMLAQDIKESEMTVDKAPLSREMRRIADSIGKSGLIFNELVKEIGHHDIVKQGLFPATVCAHGCECGHPQDAQASASGATSDAVKMVPTNE